jgi:hypothetical protein
VPGVRLSIDGEYKGELPLSIEMSRSFVGGRQFVAKFERAGYQTQEFQLHREFNPVAILDVTSIPTSGGIDVLTGALMRFSPVDYHVQMLGAGKSAASPAFRREVALWSFALASHRALQRDLARGGGEDLDAFALAACGGDAAAAAALRAATLADAPGLAGAAGPHTLVARTGALASASPALAGCRP